MREESVARRYAAALFEQAHRTGTLNEAQADLENVARTLIETPRLAAILMQPLITEANKKAALKAALEGRISLRTLGFLNLLVDKRRIDLLAEVEQEFSRRVREFNNVALANATSAVPLTETEAAALKRSLEARTGKNIDLRTSVDPSLIGGVLVRIGDTVYDGTVKGNLERLRERLLVEH